ncbi:MAG: DEAD/DEAH box helicase, partial [Polaromonas sp.]
LLFGATGSGKTEVYLRAAARVLAQDPDAQVLVMVPEINLTPQLQARFEARFAHLGRERVVALHSALTPAQRLKSWLAAHAGQARLVLGTRMAVFASLPNLRLLVVDEEHDPSYKQQEGARYSARDLAVYRAMLESSPSDGQARAQFSAGPPPGKLAPSGLEPAAPIVLEHDWTGDRGEASRETRPARPRDLREAKSVGAKPCRVLLGSATPSLESWQATLAGRYQRLTMSERIGAAGDTTNSTIQFSAGPPQGKLAPEGLEPAAPSVLANAWTGDRGEASREPRPARPRALHEVKSVGATGLPAVRRVDMNHQPKHSIIAPPLLAAIAHRVAHGQQSLIFLNRRGYAPVLACHDCGWKSECPHCSAYRVFHKIDRTLRCHHCGYTERVPRACPSCGNIDIAP